MNAKNTPATNAWLGSFFCGFQNHVNTLHPQTPENQRLIKFNVNTPHSTMLTPCILYTNYLYVLVQNKRICLRLLALFSLPF
ncbi:MAG: hypothetical protein RLZZ367_1683 [Bacteroidota bacterium]|jgi:hypothetical protein